MSWTDARGSSDARGVAGSERSSMGAVKRRYALATGEKSTTAMVYHTGMESPRQADIESLERAFDAGDYARVRGKAAEIAKRDDIDAPSKAAAAELAKRTTADPLAKWLLLVTGAL